MLKRADCSLLGFGCLVQILENNTCSLQVFKIPERRLPSQKWQETPLHWSVRHPSLFIGGVSTMKLQATIIAGQTHHSCTMLFCYVFRSKL